MTRKPNRYVGLHAHTQSSVFDGFATPEEHFDWCIENGMDALAITEHGHMNSYAAAQLAVEGWKKSGKLFRYLPGMEAYFHPDLKQWERDKAQSAIDKEDKKVADKEARERKQKVDLEEGDDNIDMSNAMTIENEDESRSTKKYNPVNRRHHLVILPKNGVGLQKLFNLSSWGYLRGFYRFPRIDANMIRELDIKGHVCVSTACVSGPIAFEVMQVLQGIQFNDLHQHLLDDKVLFEKALTGAGNAYDLLVDLFGEEDVHLELQFNKLPAQNLVNRVIIELAKRTGNTDKLIVTCDSHYPRPELWKDRELYKKLGFMNYKDYDASSLPNSVDELKCELYPKNADQLWDEYKKVSKDLSWYDDEMIADAIERTHDIAHQKIEEIKPDRKHKFPRKKLIPEGVSPLKHLIKICKEGMVKRSLDDKQQYIDRLKEEIEVIKYLDVSEYFITLQRMIELAHGVSLLAPCRGSGGGSLVNYILYITDLDPIKWNLPFSRFLSKYRVGMADVDSDFSDRNAVINELKKEFGDTNVVPISNVNTFKLKTLVKDVSKFYGIPFEEVNNVTKVVEQEVRKATTKHGEDKNLWTLKYDDAMEHCKTFREFIEKYPHVSTSIKTLFKQPRALGRHAGGVLIGENLEAQMPLITSGGEPQTPWVEGTEVKHLEKIGNFVKYDLLGLGTLRIIQRAIELILKNKGGIVELEIDSVKYRIPRYKQIKLMNGDYCEVGRLKQGDDIFIPIETK